MKKFLSQFSQTTTSSIVSILWTLGALGVTFYVLSGNAKSSETIQTQVIQAIYGLIMLMAGYYWRQKDDKKAKEQETSE